jgi:hypothetical protein
MKIMSLEVETDLGRRVVQLSAPLDVEPRGDMPQLFRSLTEMLWSVVCKSTTMVAPKVEA